MKIRTTMRPDVELDVGPEEYTDLSRMGLLVETGKAPRLPANFAVPADVAGQDTKEKN